VEHYYYLLIDLFTLSFPLARSFEPKIRFVRFWPGILLGVAIMSILFIPWDIWFTQKAVWGFNPDYITGFRIAGLPVEEWLFFFCVPFACVFIYEVLRYFFPVSPVAPLERFATMGLIFVSFVVSVVFVENIYTFITFSLLCLILTYLFLNKKITFMGHFYFAYIVILVPFLLANGALTGLFTEAPIVWYNNAENLGIRVLSIPLDDFAYNMLMLLLVITTHEWYKTRYVKADLYPIANSELPADAIV